MDANQPNPRYETPKELAGSHYHEMMRSKDGATRYLSESDHRVRLGAIEICTSVWKCGSDPAVIAACHSIADSAANDSLRACAIDWLGLGLMSSKSRDASRFLADIVMDPANPADVQASAYWALRRIQFGVGDVDLDTFLKGTISLVKSVLRENPGSFKEEDVRSNLAPEGLFPKGFWESAEEIDWDFVAKFASHN